MIQIRFLAKDEASADENLRGAIEHVGSGRRSAFRGAPELIAFLRAEQERLREAVQT